MDSWEEIVALVRQPVRYLAGEVNAVNKDMDRAELRVALAFPDIYEMGMSHLGIQILYHLLNGVPGVACDRAYAPWVDMEEIIRARKIPLCSHEARKPLRDFDMLGFSLTHELCFTNVANMLEMAGIPTFARDRKVGAWPLVIGGGPATSNPEPIAEFFDAFLFGDGEDAVVEIAEALKTWKRSGLRRDDLMESLSQIEGVYVPEFFQPEYNDDGTLAEIRALRPGIEKVRRRIVADLDSAYFPAAPLLPTVEAVHDRVMVEIARGCMRGCRFCQAGIIYRPYRERTLEMVQELVRKGLESTGYEECSLLSLSAGDYSGIEPLLIQLMHEHYPRRVAISLPSLRVESLSDPLMSAIKKVRKTGFTLAPEAATERLRRIINKPFTDNDLFETVERIFAQGWRTIKLYFMIGLPGETEDDRNAIIPLVYQIRQIGKKYSSHIQVNVSINAFVPKSHTPFQWEGQIKPSAQAEIQHTLKRELRGGHLKMKWQDARLSALEGVFSRGDRRLLPALVAARHRGLRFEDWREQFDPEGWRGAFQDAGIQPELYLRQRMENEVLPWDHLDSGVKREFLVRERARAQKEAFTPDCQTLFQEGRGCKGFCGVCGGEIKPRIGKPPEVSQEVIEDFKRSPLQPEIFFRYRIRYRRFGPARFYGHLETNRALVRTMRRARVPVRYSQGFHPLPKMVFGPAPPVGVESEAEYIEIELLSHWSVERVGEALRKVMPPGLEVQEIHEISLKTPAITGIISMFEYRIEAPAGEGKEFFSVEKIKKFFEKESFPLLQKREKGDRTVDLEKLVKFLEPGQNGVLRLGIRVVPGPGVKPQEVLAAVFDLDEDTVKKLRIIRTAAVFKAAGAVRYPGSATRVRKSLKTRPRKSY